MSPLRTLALLLLLTAPPAMSDEIETPITFSLRGKIFPEPADLPEHAALPDPLTTMLGVPVKTREDWEKDRAPELRRLFQYYMYGQMPAKPARFDAKIVREDKAALGGKATLREIAIRCTAPDVNTHLLLLIPNKRTAPEPVFLGINFNGNHTLLADPKIALPASWMPSGRFGVGEDHKASDAGRGKEADAWAIEQTIDRGYAFACFYHGDIMPDNAELASSTPGLRPPAGPALASMSPPQNIYDDQPPPEHILADIGRAVRAAAGGRRVLLVNENELLTVVPA